MIPEHIPPLGCDAVSTTDLCCTYLCLFYVFIEDVCASLHDKYRLGFVVGGVGTQRMILIDHPSGSVGPGPRGLCVFCLFLCVWSRQNWSGQISIQIYLRCDSGWLQKSQTQKQCCMNVNLWVFFPPPTYIILHLLVKCYLKQLCLFFLLVCFFLKHVKGKIFLNCFPEDTETENQQTNTLFSNLNSFSATSALNGRLNWFPSLYSELRQ